MKLEINHEEMFSLFCFIRDLVHPEDADCGIGCSFVDDYDDMKRRLSKYEKDDVENG